jgi:hypothetical protein
MDVLPAEQGGRLALKPCLVLPAAPSILLLLLVVSHNKIPRSFDLVSRSLHHRAMVRWCMVSIGLLITKLQATANKQQTREEERGPLLD